MSKPYVRELNPNSNIIVDYLITANPAAWLADGLDEALLGTMGGPDGEVAVYSEAAIIKILVDEGLSEEDAIEHMEFNIKGSGFSKNGPVFVFEPI